MDHRLGSGIRCARERCRSAGVPQAAGGGQLAGAGCGDSRNSRRIARRIRVRSQGESALAEKIRHLLAARTEHLTAAQVAAYYDAHRSQFGTPPRRALYIARARSEAEALKVKREIVSGRSFASVVKGLPLEQPIFTKDGFLADYEPNLYSEPPLNNAIYAAKPNVVAGPVRISLGYYVFEVKRLIPAVPEPFKQAQATIRAQLPNELYKQALRTFVARSRARWRSKTKCRAGYVVAKCAGAPLGFEDPYTLG